MLFLACAACHKQLPYDAKRCSACKARYCSKECQAEDWDNGHKKLCKKIARHGGGKVYCGHRRRDWRGERSGPTTTGP